MAGQGVRRLGMALGAVLLGGLMGAVQYQPVREYVAWSPRAGGKGYDYATSFSFPLEETINLYLPQFSGILDQYWGRNGIHFHSEYAGAAVLVLALLGLGGGMANRHRTHAWFWMGTLAVSLFWAWGGNTPFYNVVYAVVPGTKFFRAPSTILYVTALSTAILAAFGLERALAGRVSLRYVAGWALFALLVALLATSGALTNLAMSLLGDARADLIAANASATTAGAWRSAGVVAVVLALLVAVQRGRIRAEAAGWSLLAVVALDLWTIERHYWRFSAPASSLYAEDDIIRYLKSRPEPARVIALPLSDNMAPHDPFLAGDALMFHRIRGVLGYHGNELGRYQALFGKEEGYQSVANPNFWALTNARYFYTNASALPFQGAKLVAGPVRNAAGSMTYLFELPGANPAAWVTPLAVKLPDDQAKATVLNPLFDVRRVAVFDSGGSMPAQPVPSQLPEPLGIRVRFSRYAPGAIDLTLDAPAPAGSVLVVSENFYPGWTATADGNPVPVGRVDFVLTGVALPPGARGISLRFDSAPYHTGRVLSLAAMGLALAWLVLGGWRDRRGLPATASQG
jgi:hypothetical protein